MTYMVAKEAFLSAKLNGKTIAIIVIIIAREVGSKKTSEAGGGSKWSMFSQGLCFLDTLRPKPGPSSSLGQARPFEPKAREKPELGPDLAQPLVNMASTN